jgi:periplasmic divalent cation tolerance protein
MSEIVVALTTVPADFDARLLARALIDARLVACVTVLPGVRSIYSWEGVLEDSGEQQLVLKTTRDRLEALWPALRRRHPYDVPEFVVLRVTDGNPDYLAWVERSVQDDVNA